MMPPAPWRESIEREGGRENVCEGEKVFWFLLLRGLVETKKSRNESRRLRILLFIYARLGRYPEKKKLCFLHSLFCTIFHELVDVAVPLNK